MTLSTSQSLVTAWGNGATTSWPFPFLIPGAADAVVIVTDTTQTPAVQTVLAANQYSIAGLGNPAGGSVTYPLTGAPLTAGVSLTIQRMVPMIQATSVVNQGGFYPDVIEGALDYLTMEVQQLAAELSLCVQVPVGSGITPSGYLTTIQTAEATAASSAAAASTSATNAASSATSAAASAASAATSATTATSEAGTATTQAGIATTQAGNAAGSATAAASSATSASGSATTATTEASAASTSATSAANSATAAAASATSAAGSATTATTQASAASTSATNAAASATAAAASAASLPNASAIGAGNAAISTGSGWTGQAVITGTVATTATANAVPKALANGLLDPSFLLQAPVAGRNLLIGGDFTTNPWQRGTSFAVTSNIYTADRWRFSLSGSTTWTVSQQADAPTVAQAGVYASECLEIKCATAVASPAASDYAALLQPIEGLNCGFLGFGQSGAQSVIPWFWYKTNVSGTYSVCLQNAASNRSYVATVSLTGDGAWHKAVLPAIPGDTAGTWLNNSGVGIYFYLTYVCGSTYQVAPSSWAAGAYLATNSSPVNLGSAVNSYLRLALVQMEPGSTATNYENVPGPRVLKDCQRYHRTIPAAAVSGAGYCTAGAVFWAQYSFEAMRTTPSASMAGVTWSTNNCSYASTPISSTNSITFQFTASGTGQVSAYNSSTIALDAEL
jgi:hypothetical protein